jgi:ACS family hexuronate transporter-like MFS transporter
VRGEPRTISGEIASHEFSRPHRAVPPSPSSPPSARAWLMLLLAGVAGMLFYIDRQTLSVLKTTLQNEWAWSDADYGRLVAAFMVPYTLFYLVVGRWIDRWGTRLMMPIFLGAMSLATLGSGLAGGTVEMGFWRALLGAAEAGIVPSVMVAIVQWFPPEHRGTATTINKPLTVAGQILVAPFVVWVTLALGWRWAFLLPGALGLFCAVAWWLTDRGAPHPVPPGPMPNYRAVISRPEIRGVLLARLISDPLWFFLIFWHPALLQEQLGLSLAELGRIGWIPPASALAGIMLLGVISDQLVRRGHTPVRSRTLVLVSVSAIAPATLLLGHVTHVGVALALLAIIQVMTASWLSLSNLLMSDLVPPRMVGTTVALMSAIGASAGAVFNLAAGSLVEAVGYTTLLTLGALLHPVAAFILWRCYLRAPTPANVPETR